jgi:hypothetical protein
MCVWHEEKHTKSFGKLNINWCVADRSCGDATGAPFILSFAVVQSSGEVYSRSYSINKRSTAGQPVRAWEYFNVMVASNRSSYIDSHFKYLRI